MEIIEIKGQMIEECYCNPRAGVGNLYYDTILIEVEEAELCRAAKANGFYINALTAFIFDGWEYWFDDPSQFYIPEEGVDKKVRIMLVPQRHRFRIQK